MVERLFHGCSRVIIAPLAGGLSGSLVLTADSYDAKGQREEPTVLKLDKQKEMVGEEVAQTRYIHKLVDKGARAGCCQSCTARRECSHPRKHLQGSAADAAGIARCDSGRCVRSGAARSLVA
eukprot:1833856-Prymnesium_polylepis.3